MRDPFAKSVGRVSRVHPYQWLWEPLLDDPSFVLRPMFGGRAAYLDGKLMLYFSAKAEPWRGVFVCTERIHQTSLIADMPELSPHSVLPKWLYLPESVENFERLAAFLVSLTHRRDPRFGVLPAGRKQASARGRRSTLRP